MKPLPKIYSYFKAHSPVRRDFNQKSTAKTNNLNEKVKTARVNNVTTAGSKAVVNASVGNGENAVKSSACWIWRPTGNIIKRLMVDLLHLQEVLKEVKLLEKKTMFFPKTECRFYQPDFKLLDESQVLLKVPRQNNMYSFDLKNVIPSGVSPNPHKTYCLVVTNDYSRFSWVFFLATKDETSGILKTFITGIENQINHKVKIIRCDNGTEFKNNDMNQFCGMKGIKREFSVAKTPQQNGVAERKNMTLIEAARTMLADSLLPTTFWAEAVSTACYVQNRYPVTILNTLDPLGKFDEKADEEFFVGYSINSKAFRVFNTRTRKVEENLHINFLENKPIVAGSGPDWLFDIDSQGALNKEDDQHVQDFRAELDNLLVQQKKGYAHNTNRVSTVNPSVSAAGQGFDNANDQERIDSSTQDVNTVGPSINTASETINTGSSNINTASMQSLEATGIFSGAYEDEDVGVEADLSNVEITMNVSPIPTTRIHKDHPKYQINGDINSATKTRRMTKITKEHAMVSYIKRQRRTNHKDYQNCLFACFLSQIEPKKVIQALTDPSWIKAMQEELLQFKLQKVWTLVDLPKGKGLLELSGCIETRKIREEL
ncbi:putative ribonuclease H-like domain-containing protein [Tanacetum coccineum]